MAKSKKSVIEKTARTCIAALFVVGCGGEDVVAFHSGDSGGTVSAAGGTAMSSGGSTGSDAETTGYRRSGYGGGPADFHGVVGQEGTYVNDEEFAACINGGFVTRSHLDSADCTAGTLCSPLCESDSDCPSGGSAVPRCVQCNSTVSDGGMCGPAVSACVLECTTSSECPTDMACLTDAVGRQVCMFPDAPIITGCNGYCADTFHECGDDVPCCDGMACSPTNTCEVVTCLEFAWKCGEGLPECCDGLSCRDGYCQTP